VAGVLQSGGKRVREHSLLSQGLLSGRGVGLCGIHGFAKRFRAFRLACPTGPKLTFFIGHGFGIQLEINNARLTMSSADLQIVCFGDIRNFLNSDAARDVVEGVFVLCVDDRCKNSRTGQENQQGNCADNLLEAARS
jgi:hypothetical protein